MPDFFEIIGKRKDTDIIIVPTIQEAMLITKDECDAVRKDAIAEIAIIYKSPVTGVSYIKPVWIVEHYIDV